MSVIANKTLSSFLNELRKTLDIWNKERKASKITLSANHKILKDLENQLKEKGIIKTNKKRTMAQADHDDITVKAKNYKHKVQKKAKQWSGQLKTDKWKIVEYQHKINQNTSPSSSEVNKIITNNRFKLLEHWNDNDDEDTRIIVY